MHYITTKLRKKLRTNKFLNNMSYRCCRVISGGTQRSREILHRVCVQMKLLIPDYFLLLQKNIEMR